MQKHTRNYVLLRQLPQKYRPQYRRGSTPILFVFRPAIKELKEYLVLVPRKGAELGASL